MIGQLYGKPLRNPGGEWVVSFTTRADPRPLYDEFTDKDVSVEIKKASKRRSKTANDFCWALCSDIGNAIKPPIPKEEVYRNAIKDVGKFETVHIRADAVDEFRRIWNQHGIGWFTEVVDYSPVPGYKAVFAYSGSSTYTVDEMSRLIELLKQDALNMGLVIPISKEEEERLLKEWGKPVQNKLGGPTNDDTCRTSKSAGRQDQRNTTGDGTRTAAD